MKYELVESDTINNDGATLTRIRALVDIPEHNVKAGELGGYIEKESNLSHAGTCWVSDNARVSSDARVFGAARVSGTARISGTACVSGKASVSGDAHVASNARIDSNDKVMWFSHVGSENGTLTVYATETGLDCTRGCFNGTVDEFLAASAVTHAASPRIHDEYQLAIKLAKLRIGRK